MEGEWWEQRFKEWWRLSRSDLRRYRDVLLMAGIVIVAFMVLSVLGGGNGCEECWPNF